MHYSHSVVAKMFESPAVAGEVKTSGSVVNFSTARFGRDESADWDEARKDNEALSLLAEWLDCLQTQRDTLDRQISFLKSELQRRRETCDARERAEGSSFVSIPDTLEQMPRTRGSECAKRTVGRPSVWQLVEVPSFGENCFGIDDQVTSRKDFHMRANPLTPETTQSESALDADLENLADVAAFCL